MRAVGAINFEGGSTERSPSDRPKQKTALSKQCGFYLVPGPEPQKPLQAFIHAGFGFLDWKGTNKSTNKS